MTTATTTCRDGLPWCQVCDREAADGTRYHRGVLTDHELVKITALRITGGPGDIGDEDDTTYQVEVHDEPPLDRVQLALLANQLQEAALVALRA